MSHDEIKAALEAATPGPWDYYRPHPNYGAYMVERVAPEGHLSGDCVAVCEDVDADANAHLIMHAPTWLAELLAEVESLARWKNEALPVIAGLQELGAALGIPLGKRITGPDALGAVQALTERAEKAEQAIQRVRAIHYAADNDLARTPVCSNCEGRAGVHDCGCWADEDRQPVCGHCNESWKGASVPWPCATVRALDGGEQHG